MKHLLLVAFLAVAAGGQALAQKNSIVGKWNFASLSTPEFSFDLENPAATKKMIIEEVKKEGGAPLDSAMLDMAFNMMASAFKSMSFEFTADGQAVFSAPGEEGGLKKDIASYTVDYTKGTLTTTENIDGAEKKETIRISFAGDYLTMENVEKKEIIKVKRAK